MLTGLLQRVRAGWPELTIFAVALMARLWVVVGDGGFGGNFYYDPAVYYAAGDALGHGRLPYTGFVLIHPPVIALVNVPIALLGRLTTDHAGFIAGNVAYTVLAAVNAVLVIRVAQAYGVSRRGALLAGAFYATWIGAITAEFLIRLEPLGNFFLLAGLLVLARARRNPTAWAPAAAAGALFGTLLSVKIWWVVPVAVLLGWQLAERAYRRVGWLLAGVAVAGLVIDGPFFVVAGRRMFRAIITAQLDRTSNGVGAHARLDKLTALSQIAGDRFNDDSVSGRAGVQLVVALFVALVLATAVLAARTVFGRVMVVALAAEAVVFFTTPTWFYTYCDYLAVPLALTVGAAAANRRSRSGAGVAAASAAFAAVTCAVTFLAGGLHMVAPLTGSAHLARGAAHVPCIVADTPMTLIELNALDRSFTRGCHDWVDLTGVEHGGGPDPRDRVTPGRPNPHWSEHLCDYLTSGDAVIIVNPGTWRALPPACAARIRRAPVVVRSGNRVVHLLDRTVH